MFIDCLCRRSCTPRRRMRDLGRTCMASHAYFVDTYRAHPSQNECDAMYSQLSDVQEWNPIPKAAPPPPQPLLQPACKKMPRNRKAAEPNGPPPWRRPQDPMCCWVVKAQFCFLSFLMWKSVLFAWLVWCLQEVDHRHEQVVARNREPPPPPPPAATTECTEVVWWCGKKELRRHCKVSTYTGLACNLGMQIAILNIGLYYLEPYDWSVDSCP